MSNNWSQSKERIEVLNLPESIYGILIGNGYYTIGPIVKDLRNFSLKKNCKGLGEERMQKVNLAICHYFEDF